MTDQNGLFVYGVVPGDVEPTPDAVGVGDPPAPVEVVRHDELAALVSRIELAEPVGTPADLTAYKELLDQVAVVAPVLPVRFGSVRPDAEAVVEFIEARYDEFLRALDDIEGRVEYIVHGRYVEPELVAGIIATNPAAAELARQVRGRPVEATREQRIQLGQLLSQEVEPRRDADTRRLLDALATVVAQSTIRPPSHEQDAVHLAFLVDVDRESDFVAAVEDAAREQRERISMRLLGPLAPYDFVSPAQPVG
ncbi:MAG TPA: GvpL/GvpF family gas vesicle protein [Micromonospora sp.]